MIFKTKKVLACLIILLILFSNCRSSEKNVPSKSYNNIIILLDLSDRILNKGQIERDKRVINTIFKEFVLQIKKDLFFASKAKFKIVIARQEQNPNSIEMNELLDSFYINMETTLVQLKKKIKSKDITKNLNRLYELALYSKSHNDYKGADIVGYFRDDLSSDLQDSSGYKNKIVILTDGYLYVNNAHGSKATWPVVTDLQNSDVVILELSPTDYKSGELQEMKVRLNKWIVSMNSGNLLLQHATTISTVIDKLRVFLNNNIENTTNKVSGRR